MPIANAQVHLGAWEPVCLLVPWPLAQLNIQIIGVDADVEVQVLSISDVHIHRSALSTSSLVSGKLEKRRKKNTLQVQILSIWHMRAAIHMGTCSVIHVPTLVWACETPRVL